MATPSGAARVVENKQTTKQIKETFEKMREFDTKSKQHHVLEERLKRISLALEKQQSAEAAQRALAQEMLQKNEEYAKQNERILEQLAKLEHEEKVREEMLKARQVQREQYATEVEELRYKGLHDIPREDLLEMKEAEVLRDIQRPPSLGSKGKTAAYSVTSTKDRGGFSSARQSVQKTSLPRSVNLNKLALDVSPRYTAHEAKATATTPKHQKSTSSSQQSPRKAHVVEQTLQVRSKLSNLKPVEGRKSTAYRNQVRDQASAYSSNGIPTKINSVRKETPRRRESRDTESVSSQKRPGWNISTNNATSRRTSVVAQDKQKSDKKSAPKTPQIKSQQAKESALTLLAKKVETIKDAKKAAKVTLASNQKVEKPARSTSRSVTPKPAQVAGELIPKFKKEYEPALARSRANKEKSVQKRTETPSERNSEDTNQTSQFGTNVAERGVSKGYYSRPEGLETEGVRVESNYYTEPTGFSFQDQLLGSQLATAEVAEAPWIQPVPLLAESELSAAASMARDESRPGLGLGLESGGEWRQQSSGSQNIKLVWSSADVGAGDSRHHRD